MQDLQVLQKSPKARWAWGSFKPNFLPSLLGNTGCFCGRQADQSEAKSRTPPPPSFQAVIQTNHRVQGEAGSADKRRKKAQN